MARSSAILVATTVLFLLLRRARADTVPEVKPWRNGDLIPVMCLNRTIDTGEHVTDSHGDLQYIPFPVCSETNKPLQLRYGLSLTQNCTITLEDSLFHLLEFYIHNDAPLTCRIPSSPLSQTIPSSQITGAARTGVLGSESTYYTPLIMALSGTLQLSHLHVANELNLLLHTDTLPSSKGRIDSAAAYSISASTKQTKIIIGDSLPLTFHIRWYKSSFLPLSSTSSAHHGFWSTLSYCLFAAGASAAVCIVYFRGIDLPRRLKFHGRDALNGGLPKYNGYGYVAGAGSPAFGIGNGTANGNGSTYGFSGTGKRD